MTAITTAGQTRHLRLSLIAGIDAPDPETHMLRDAAAGAGAGALVAGAVVAGFAVLGLLTRNGPDQPVSSGSSTTFRDVGGFFLPPTAVGAVVGFGVGLFRHHRQTFDWTAPVVPAPTGGDDAFP